MKTKNKYPVDSTPELKWFKVHVTGKNQIYTAVLKKSTLEDAKTASRRLWLTVTNPDYAYIENEKGEVLFSHKR